MIPTLALLTMIFVGAYLAIVVISNRRIHPKTGAITPTNKQPTRPDASSTLAVLTWNIGYAGLGKDADLIIDKGQSIRALSELQIARAAHGIADWLAAQSSDVICLQESAKAGFLTRGVPLRSIIAETLTQRQSVFWTDMRSVLVPRLLKVDHGMSVHSRISFRACHAELLPQDDTYFFGILKKHYGFIVSRFAIEEKGREWVVFNIHLSAFDTDGAARKEQLKHLMRRAQAEYSQGNFVVIAGDWNMRLSPTDFGHQSDPASLLWTKDFPQEALPKHWQLAFDPMTPTVRSLNKAFNPGETYSTIVDGFVYSPNVQLSGISAANMGFELADHQPVEASFVARE